MQNLKIHQLSSSAVLFCREASLSWRSLYGLETKGWWTTEGEDFDIFFAKAWNTI